MRMRGFAHNWTLEPGLILLTLAISLGGYANRINNLFRGKPYSVRLYKALGDRVQSEPGNKMALSRQ